MSSNNNNSKNKFNLLDKDLPKSNTNYNGIVITILTALYILLIFKLASIISSSYQEENEQTKSYVMVVYILSIMGLVIGFVWLKSNSNGNFIIKRSLTIGGILSLFYTIINYWEYLDDYSKLIMIVLSISIIIYYVY